MTALPETEVGGRIVRPYTMTGGRTGVGEPMIALEALVSVTPEGMRTRRRYRWEAAEIIARTRSETAIIELAAMLEVPVGVIRVLSADLRENGALRITDPAEQPTPKPGDPAYTELLQKVLDGIQSL
jgi:hypothetical protein